MSHKNVFLLVLFWNEGTVLVHFSPVLWFIASAVCLHLETNCRWKTRSKPWPLFCRGPLRRGRADRRSGHLSAEQNYVLSFRPPRDITQLAKRRKKNKKQNNNPKKNKQTGGYSVFTQGQKWRKVIGFNPLNQWEKSGWITFCPSSCCSILVGVQRFKINK